MLKYGRIHGKHLLMNKFCQWSIIYNEIKYAHTAHKSS